MDLETVNAIGNAFANSLIWIIGGCIVSFVINVQIHYGIVRWLYDFFGTQYKYVEVLHQGIVNKKFIVKSKDIPADGRYNRDGKEYNFLEIINPIRISSLAERYTFKNDNVLPLINGDTVPVKITGIQQYEILTKTADSKHFIMDNKFWKSLLEHYFVAKIKKEKENTMEAILNFLNTPAGKIALIILAAVVGIMALSGAFKT